jgi:hypothetical protein
MDHKPISGVRLAHVIEQLEADVERLAGGTSPVIVPDSLHRTVLRGDIAAHLTGLLDSVGAPLTEGDIVRINGEGPRLRVTYGPHTDFSANFSGIGWFLAYIEEYAGDVHTTLGGWCAESLCVEERAAPVRGNGVELCGPGGRSPLLSVHEGKYQLAPGAQEGSSIGLDDDGAAVCGTLRFGFFSGRGYGPRFASGFVWFVETEDGVCRPVQCVSALRMRPCSPSSGEQHF